MQSNYTVQDIFPVNLFTFTLHVQIYYANLWHPAFLIMNAISLVLVQII